MLCSIIKLSFLPRKSFVLYVCIENQMKKNPIRFLLSSAWLVFYHLPNHGHLWLWLGSFVFNRPDILFTGRASWSPSKKQVIHMTKVLIIRTSEYIIWCALLWADTLSSVFVGFTANDFCTQTISIKSFDFPHRKPGTEQSVL